MLIVCLLTGSTLYKVIIYKIYIVNSGGLAVWHLVATVRGSNPEINFLAHYVKWTLVVTTLRVFSAPSFRTAPL